MASAPASDKFKYGESSVQLEVDGHGGSLSVSAAAVVLANGRGSAAMNGSFSFSASDERYYVRAQESSLLALEGYAEGTYVGLPSAEWGW